MTDQTTVPPSVAVDLPLHRAKRAAQALLPHVGTDDVGPVLTVAQVSGGYLIGTDRYSVGRFTLQGADTPPTQDPGSLAARIRAESDQHFAARLKDWQDQREVRYYSGGERTTDTQEMMVPRAALQRISTLSRALLPSGKMGERHARVRIEAYQPSVIPQGSRAGEVNGHDWVDVILYDGERAVLRQTFMGVKGNFPPVGRLLEDWAPAEESAPLGLAGWNLAKVTKFADRSDSLTITPGKTTSTNRLAPLKVEVGMDFVALIQPNLIL